MAKAKVEKQVEINEILKINTGNAYCCVLGTSPLILNRMSEKAKHELLMPHGRKTAIEKAVTLKHRPVDEYRASAHRISDEAAETYLAVPSAAIKRAISTAALDLPGTKKAQIGRLTWVPGDYVGVFGVPKLYMTIVRQADMNRTPDVRTRAIVPEWACRVTIRYAMPLITSQAVANLLAAAGITVGVGDGRQEKGALSFGQFEVVDEQNEDFQRIMATGGREAQQTAMEVPVAYDDETTELLSWYDTELASRRTKGKVA